MGITIYTKSIISLYPDVTKQPEYKFVDKWMFTNTKRSKPHKNAFGDR